MDTNNNVLAAEIDRIVNSPYPTQLKVGPLYQLYIATSDQILDPSQCSIEHI